LVTAFDICHRLPRLLPFNIAPSIMKLEIFNLSWNFKWSPLYSDPVFKFMYIVMYAACVEKEVTVMTKYSTVSFTIIRDFS
jgi:hypothetical protein